MKGKTIAALALALGVFAASGQTTDCIRKIESTVAESEQVLPLDIAGVTMQAMKWDEGSSTLTLDMCFAVSLAGQEAEERMRLIRPGLLSIFVNMPPLADMMRCLAEEGGRFVLAIYGSDDVGCPGYTMEYGGDEIVAALDGLPVSNDDYDLRFMQGLAESASVGLPKRMDDDTVLRRVYLDGKVIVYDFVLDDTPTGTAAMRFMTECPMESHAVIADDMAQNGDTAALIPVADKGFGMRYRYRLEGSEDYVDVDFTPEQLMDIILAGS